MVKIDIGLYTPVRINVPIKYYYNFIYINLNFSYIKAYIYIEFWQIITFFKNPPASTWQSYKLSLKKKQTVFTNRPA